MTSYKNADQQVIGFVLERMEAESTIWLCTVLSTWGSSPRPRGSLFVFDERGTHAGSLSGGCVEEDLVAKTLQDHADGANCAQAGQCRIAIFGATAEEAARLRLPCGGQLKIAVECLSGDAAKSSQASVAAALVQFRELSKSLDARKPAVRSVVIDPYQAQLLNCADLTDQQFRQLQADCVIDEPGRFRHLLGPSYTLFLIGVSEVSKAVARMATLLDYEIIVCDPRPELLAEWPIEGVTLIQGMPDDVIRAQPALDHTAILALTHDPRIDDMGLMEALTTDAFYIGAMGSERTSANRRERMLQLDLTGEQIAALHAPVGLSIGSRTPSEIALAILAEITLKRRLRAASATDTRQ
jgi:xanthine dehydrogenase accessory factor